MTGVAERLVSLCEHNPPKNVDPHPKLFSDLDDDELPRVLFNLWQMGLLDAEYDEESQTTLWQVTDFAFELLERELLQPYMTALDREIQIHVGPDDLIDPRGSA